MKLKYYMRGLGIGMVVTAFILSIVLGGEKQTMSDDEIKARAKELGMVEGTYLTQISGNKETTKESETEIESESESQPEVETETTTEPETEIVPELETETVPETEPETESQQESETESETVTEPETTTEPEEVLHITITVNPGESSVSVSRSLAEAGLVADAKEYDRYLCNNGYDKSISIGTYEIPEGASFEEIAKIITKQR